MNRKYAIVPANEIEIIDDNLEVQIDNKKINEIRKKMYMLLNKNALYAIDTDGNYQKYKNLSEAAAKTGMTLMTINNILSDRERKVKTDYIFMPANEVETMDEDCNIIVDKKAIYTEYQRRWHHYKRKTVYVINSKGEYQKFKNRQEAAKQLGLNGHNTSSRSVSKKGEATEYIIISASSLETIDEDGNIIINKGLIDNIVKSTVFS